MTTVIVLLVANLIAGVANLIGIVHLVRARRAPDPSSIIRATALAERVLAGDRAETWTPPAVEAGRTHYVVRRSNGHDEFTLYDGHDSDLAYAAWIKMERDPATHPGYHEFLENGRHRAKRHHTEIPT